MPTIFFAGPEFIQAKQYYNPTKVYIQPKSKPKQSINPKQKASENFYNYFIENQSTLPSKEVVKRHRNEIERLILGGMTAEQAYKTTFPLI